MLTHSRPYPSCLGLFQCLSRVLVAQDFAHTPSLPYGANYNAAQSPIKSSSEMSFLQSTTLLFSNRRVSNRHSHLIIRTTISRSFHRSHLSFLQSATPSSSNRHVSGLQSHLVIRTTTSSSFHQSHQLSYRLTKCRPRSKSRVEAQSPVEARSRADVMLTSNMALCVLANLCFGSWDNPDAGRREHRPGLYMLARSMRLSCSRVSGPDPAT